MSELTTRLTERAKAFNDAGLTHGVADLLTEAAAELTRIEHALEREGLADLLRQSRLDGRSIYGLTDTIRAHLLGDNEGKTTL